MTLLLASALASLPSPLLELAFHFYTFSCKSIMQLELEVPPNNLPTLVVATVVPLIVFKQRYSWFQK